MGDDAGGQKGYAKLLGKRVIERKDEQDQTYLEDQVFDELITGLPARMGRIGGAATAGSDGCFVTLGSAKSLSRHHATIDWNFDNGCYSITCLSKNGMVVDKTHYNKDELAFLKDKSAIRVGPVSFYFHLPPQAEVEAEGEEEEEDEEEQSTVEESDQEESGGSSSAAAMQVGLSTMNMNQDQGAANGTSTSKPAVQRKPPLPKPEGSASYSDLTFAAFVSEELREIANTTGVTSAEVVSYILARFPEWSSPDQRKKQLSNGVQNVLTRKFVKQEVLNQPTGNKRGARWKIDPSAAHLAVPLGAPKNSKVAPSSSSPSAAAAPVTAGGGQKVVEDGNRMEKKEAEEEDLEVEDDDDEMEEEDDDSMEAE